MTAHERRIDLGRIARGVYFRGQSLEQAVPEIGQGKLLPTEIEKVHRGVHIAMASNAMMNRIDSLIENFPPYGLVDYRVPLDYERQRLEDMNLDLYFAPVPVDERLRDRSSQDIVPRDFKFIIDEYADYLSGTMYYALIKEFQEGNEAIVKLPNVRDGRFGEPTHDIARGAFTSSTVISNVLKAVFDGYMQQTGNRPSFGEFRRLALGSTGVVLDLAGVNIDAVSGLPPFGHDYEFSDADDIYELDLDKGGLRFLHPGYDELAHPWDHKSQYSTTTKCPAMISLVPGEASPILRTYHRMLELIA